MHKRVQITETKFRDIIKQTICEAITRPHRQRKPAYNKSLTRRITEGVIRKLREGVEDYAYSPVHMQMIADSFVGQAMGDGIIAKAKWEPAQRVMSYYEYEIYKNEWHCPIEPGVFLALYDEDDNLLYWMDYWEAIDSYKQFRKATKEHKLQETP